MKELIALDFQNEYRTLKTKFQDLQKPSHEPTEVAIHDLSLDLDTPDQSVPDQHDAHK
jgi:hypothetical protein